MKISKEKFEEFVSAYLDNEATPEEKIALSKCIMQDREMARIFYRECKIYAATCKIYGREPSLQKLDGIPNPLNPVKKKTISTRMPNGPQQPCSHQPQCFLFALHSSGTPLPAL